MIEETWLPILDMLKGGKKILLQHAFQWHPSEGISVTEDISEL
ncbi:MAG TPA: hypothetical protein VNB68_02900 [Nitrososphaeraceae archaeon]|nr:hypothetical protein [Nitrososphaeraceae archaeon]